MSFFYGKAVVHSEFIPTGKVVNSMFYVGVHKRLKQSVNHVRSEIKDPRKLNPDNAPNDTAFVVVDYLTRIGVATVPHTPYSLDLAPPNFFLLLEVKEALKGSHLDTIDNIKNNVDKAIKGNIR